MVKYNSRYGETMSKMLAVAMPRSNKPKRNDKAVKIDRDLAVKAKVIADQLGFSSAAEYLSGLLRPLIERDWPKALKKLSAEEQA
jgi:hypothetical protein